MGTDPAGPRSTWEDVVWRASDGLKARIHRPVVPTPGSAGSVVVDVHGGAWNGWDRTLGQPYQVAAAEAGLTVVAVDFRDGRQARHPAAVTDIAEAVAWIRAGADGADLGGGAPVDRVALTGNSSGGHLALLTALTALDTGLDTVLVAALWPPVDPLGRYRYARSMVGRPVPEGNRLDAERLMASTEAYFGDETTMAEASVAEVVRSGRARHLPPVWLVEAGADLNVPAELLDDLVETWRGAGGTIERTAYPGEIHGFGHGAHPGAERFRADLVARLLEAVADGPDGAPT
jgi:acetyl esterase